MNSVKGYWVVAGFALLVGCSANQTTSNHRVVELSATDQNVVAMIGDEKITEESFLDDMDSQLKGEFARAQQSYRSAKKGVLSQMIFDRLVDKEAKAMKLTKEELVKKEVHDKAGQVSDQDIQAFYDKAIKQFAASGQTPPPLDGPIKEQIKTSLQREKSGTRQQEYTDRLFSKYNVSLVLPDLIRFKIAKGNLPAKGKEGAKVTIVEFSDYHCPMCRRGGDNLMQALEKVGIENVEYRFRDFPLESLHPRAKPASLAARCAHEQGKFWEYHDKIFENQGKRTDEDFISFAKDLKLDDGKFTKCYEDKKYLEDVEKDIEAGKLAGLSGTPAYFVNGILISGAVPPERMIEAIQKEL